MKHVFKIIVLVSLLLSCKQEPTVTQVVSNTTVTNKEKLSDYLNELEKSGFSGSVLVAQKGKILLEKGYGYSNRENKIKSTSETVFDIGSITKQFTGAAILRLEMQGKLSVEDKLSKYISNIPVDKKDITLHQLLTHSSGFQSGIGDDYERISTQEFIEEAFKRKLLFEPGTKFTYSNVGYSFLGIIIEKVSGMSYEEYLMKHLWKPSGMDQTGYKKPSFKDIAVGYRKNKHWGKPTDKKWDVDGPYWHLKANGGVLSTTQDMYKWHRALLGDKILNATAKSKYYSKHIEEGEGAGSYYGYGWAIFPTPRNTELIAHNGGNGIFFADMWRYLDEDITIIMMTNAVQRKFENIASQVAGILLKPDFNPIVSEQSKGTIIGEMADQLVDEFMKTMNQNDQNAWKSFIDNRMTPTFKNSFSIEKHIAMFKQLHEDLKGGKIVQIMVKENEVILGVETNNEVEQILFDVIPNAKGKLRIEGIR
ncbi:serine hydrolase domain-containing protein [Aquimarina macrocephali]|uniref:serine hydrolase domain-containing protein n=1 Tax=Aquimarina macrocephali TaxID=666563 RepID=UPI0004BB906F|nr:serine hydrolase domain-containing protein [Aquimarina macrocephali]